jgi:ABC-type sulfate transport system substrate-binding protein
MQHCRSHLTALPSSSPPPAAGLIEAGWKKRYPNNAAVCESTAAMVVRKDNPKNIQGWDDLLRDDVEVGQRGCGCGCAWLLRLAAAAAWQLLQLAGCG